MTLAGSHGDHPPTDDEGYLAWARTLPTGDIADLIRDEEPLGPDRHPPPAVQPMASLREVALSPNRFRCTRRLRLQFQPDLRPRHELRGPTGRRARPRNRPPRNRRRRNTRAFYRAAAKIIANPWAIAAGADFAFPETTGPKPPMTDVINRYVAKAIVAAQHDGVVATAMWEVQNLLSPPQSLMRPTVVARVVRAARRGPAIEHLAAPTAASLPTPSRAS